MDVAILRNDALMRFEARSNAIVGRCAITIIDEQGTQPSRSRTVTHRVSLISPSTLRGNPLTLLVQVPVLRASPKVILLAKSFEHCYDTSASKWSHAATWRCI